MQIRATQLEKFRTCKHRYKFEPAFTGTSEAFEFGNSVHKYTELALTNQLNDEIKDLLLQQWPVKQRFMIIQMSEKVLEYVKQNELTYIVSELTMKKEYAHRDVILEGTMDLLFKTKDDKYIMVDLKTAASKWTDDHCQQVKQKIIYPVLFEKIYSKHIDRFEYRVLTKTSSPELYPVVARTEDNYPEEIEKILAELQAAEESQARPPNYPNYSCYYCPLKLTCQQYKTL